MGMGYSSNVVYIINEDKLEQIVSQEYKALLELLIDSEYSAIQDLNYNCEFSDDKLVNAFTNLQKKFMELTGLTINIGYHDSSANGSRGDEVDGIYFHIDQDDLFQETHEFARFKLNYGINTIETKSFVTFG